MSLEVAKIPANSLNNPADLQNNYPTDSQKMLRIRKKILRIRKNSYGFAEIRQHFLRIRRNSCESANIHANSQDFKVSINLDYRLCKKNTLPLTSAFLP